MVRLITVLVGKSCPIWKKAITLSECEKIIKFWQKKKKQNVKSTVTVANIYIFGWIREKITKCLLKFRNSYVMLLTLLWFVKLTSRKNFVNAPFVQKKLVKSWFHEFLLHNLGSSNWLHGYISQEHRSSKRSW